MDCSWGDSRISSALEVSSEHLNRIKHGTNAEYLHSLAVLGLDPKSTKTIFTSYEPIFVELCAQWLSKDVFSSEFLAVTSALAKLLPIAPYLAVFAEELVLRRVRRFDALLEQADDTFPSELTGASELGQISGLRETLLAIFRLLCFDVDTFSPAVTPGKIQLLFRHSDRTVRYLAIRVICLYVGAADAAMEAMIAKYVGREAVQGQWEDKEIDYLFLSLWEEKRVRDVGNELQRNQKDRHAFFSQNGGKRTITREDLWPLTAELCGILLPRLGTHIRRESALVPTNTTNKNMRCLAQALLTTKPLLLTGLSGSGKTYIVMEAAKELGVDSSMLTLHLNEQTDAKLLIGMYTTGSTPGSFKWQPGILNTAVREGRWVLVEDLDRAPTDVLSVILPLIEKRELLIPSRGERIRAAAGFKLIATMRSTLNSRGDEVSPAAHMLGMRLWRHIHTQMPSNDEFKLIISKIFPLLQQSLPDIMNVYHSVRSLHQRPNFFSNTKALLGRPPSPRDLMKWCRRLNNLLRSAGLQMGSEPIPESLHDTMFMEAADCFAGALQTYESRYAVVSRIAEDMHVPPQRVLYYLNAHTPRYASSNDSLIIGRARLRKRRGQSSIKSRSNNGKRPFATTNHTLRLLEQVAVAVQMSDPVLLVGETGTGKTSVVQQLAQILGYKLTVVNLSQQSESGDLLGGFKPVNVRSLAIPMKEEFDELFDTTFSAKKNQRYLDILGKCITKGQWVRAVTLWKEALKMVDGLFATTQDSRPPSPNTEGEHPKKRRRLEISKNRELKFRWEHFAKNVQDLDVQLSAGPKGFAFKFMEGNIVKAARNGDWVLLDEINLASPDTLEGIADLLHNGLDGSPSILLSETGEVERVRAHPDFRIFGAMNPATDIGKKDLPVGLRSRFAEIYVDSPDKDFESLTSIVKAYIEGYKDERAAHDIARLYLEVKDLANTNQLVDGANQKPHFSLRTLTRTLSYVVEIAPIYGLRRSLYEGFSMAFLTLLNKSSERLLLPLIDKYILGTHRNSRSLLNQIPKIPGDGRNYVQFKHYWMPKGQLPVEEQPHYIITPFVERNMLNLIRATSTRRFPILVQGPTSSGKTSMIEYLAKITGNKFVRINNHEHTDLQEYLGSYVSGTDGQLRFHEGLLVQALRKGHWIVLDELNLAPTDVLEALNRLLDDNRELLIPETQETVRPHSNFVLFATQNPPGLYGGRKFLSRAFRNRFLELHFDDIPEDELETILRERSQIAPSFCERIVAVYRELSLLRQSSRLFEQKNSFATLRDLFRWALRDADDREQLAANGFMLLAERVRKPEERLAVKRIIEKVCKVKIDEARLYDADSSPEVRLFSGKANSQGVVWTNAMRRLFILVSNALRNNEPVLLVGETGSGKTTVCQMLAEASSSQLFIVNAHQNTETGDIIGAQRPLRNRSSIEAQLRDDLSTFFQLCPSNTETDRGDQNELLAAFERADLDTLAQAPFELRERIKAGISRLNTLFEWSDGILVQAMKTGQFFLLDEISLADDSVLERLNSVLEPQRTLLLAEKGSLEPFVSAADGFQFLATMNPGGDYGKRELSPALRNRFTEIWVPPISEVDDALCIVDSKLVEHARQFSNAIVQFSRWFSGKYCTSAAPTISIRDVLAWTEFINLSGNPDPYFGVLHGAAMVYIDTIGANPAAMLAISPDRICRERQECLQKLSRLLDHDVASIYFQHASVISDTRYLSIGSFSIPKAKESSDDSSFSLLAPTTKMNALRVIRALQLRKPILLEGNPGVGKTTLVAAIAQSAGQPLTRINLSEQTDLMDLFGSDVPVEGADAGHFVWRDAPFLQAMQKGHWVLLDEMNLASQSVLEGLNACLDHRGEVYISELDQTFTRHGNFVIFAAQNPHHQGGGRKGLPASFVNRFSVVYTDMLTAEDLTLICTTNFPTVPNAEIASLIQFVRALEEEVVQKRLFGSRGAPWEFNLRDILRWLKLLTSKDMLLRSGRPEDFLPLIFRQRFRSMEDRLRVDRIFSDTFSFQVPNRHLFHNLGKCSYQVGLALLERDSELQNTKIKHGIDTKRVLCEIESLIICVQQSWPCILVGVSGSGKTSLIKYLATIAGATLVEFHLNSDVDTMDLVGGYEQIDPQRLERPFFDDLELFLRSQVVLCSKSECSAIEAALLLDLVKIRQSEQANLTLIHEFLTTESQKSPSTFLTDLTVRCSQLLKRPMNVEKPRFEWVDGILVEALEQGKWLVLDNANLCSSSVLDRLNSLLEPNGYLSINEHRSPEGNAKIVKPHPDFRLFLTMDPRHGELSRAMRNRAVEIFLSPPPEHDEVALASQGLVFYESSQDRFRSVTRMAEESHHSVLWQPLVEVGLNHLSLYDTTILASWSSQAEKGLIDLSKEQASALTLRADRWRTTVSGLLGNEIAKYYSDIFDGVNVPEEFPQVQPLHPLINTPLLSLMGPGPPKSSPYFLGALLEIGTELLAMSEAMDGIVRTSSLLKVSQMTRLERSFASHRVSALRKDTTNAAFGFLITIKDLISQWILIGISAEQRVALSTEAFSTHLTQVLFLWWNMYEFVHSIAFDDSIFQVHLSAWKDWLLSCSKEGIPQQLTQPALKALDMFRCAWQLSTGLYMEKLWKLLKPTVPSSPHQLHALSQMRELAVRFDAVVWKSQAPIKVITSIRGSIANALETILRTDPDCTALLKGFEASILELETKSSDNDQVTPYFAPEFEGLLQYYDMLDSYVHSALSWNFACPDHLVPVLAVRPTRQIKTEMSHECFPVQCFSNLFNYVGTHRKPSESLVALKGVLPITMLQKLNDLGSVTLKHLDLLKLEVRALAKNTAISGPIARLRQLDILNTCLCGLLKEVLVAHSELFSEPSLDLLLLYVDSRRRNFLNHSSEAADTQSSIPHAPEFNKDDASSNLFRAVFESHFWPCIVYMSKVSGSQDAYMMSGSAWAHFALGCLLLYVPDRVFDPATRPLVERQWHGKKKNKLQTRLHALQAFEGFFTGQSTNVLSEITKRALLDHGDNPPVPAIIRPEPSSLSNLQGEFSNLLNLVSWKSLGANLMQSIFVEREGSFDEAELLELNVAHIIDRLSGFSGYEDITYPVIGMLQSLRLGVSLHTLGSSRNREDGFAAYVFKVTPFLGGTPDFLCERLPVTYSGDGRLPGHMATQGHQPREQGQYISHFLQRCTIKKSVESVSSFSGVDRRAISDAFNILYKEWKQNLEEDREKQAAQAGLYKYKGGQDDVDEEEVKEIFPTYDNPGEMPQSLSKSTESQDEIGSRVAKLHADLFLSNISTSTHLISLLEMSGTQIGCIRLEEKSTCAPELLYNTMSALLLSLNAHIGGLESSSVSARTYDFYMDPNLAETAKLVSIVDKVKGRFSELKESWPEHATIQDVMGCCEEILAFRHVEPIAKFLTKAEKLHGFIHEWQMVASKEYSAASPYDGLTDLLIGWRRLELSTWSRLFDLENEKCDKQARSWWFIAYEAVVGVPLSSIESGADISQYPTQLLETLEMFLSATTLGQYLQRLRLLEQLKEHVLLLAKDVELMAGIYTALLNFLCYHSHFMPYVEEVLQKGRMTLEKEIREVILLASWKDTNIIALRDSSRRSHHKLFKLVRKYRGLLGQSVQDIITQGPQEGPSQTEMFLHGTQPLDLTLPDQKALDICHAKVQSWYKKPSRLVNISDTLSLMRRFSNFPDSTLDCVGYLDTFASDLITDIQELQKATPSVYSEEKKNVIKHLKNRKRKLFADTMRQLRQMGLKSHLGSDTLHRQRSIPIILANTVALPEPFTVFKKNGSNFYFHKTINLITKLREASQDHSKDLTSGEVSRSIGYLDSLLAAILKQRPILAASINDLSVLEAVTAQFGSLCPLDPPAEFHSSESIYDSSIEQCVRWLPHILEVAENIICIHSELSEEDNSVVQGELRHWKNTFGNMHEELKLQSSLPDGIFMDIHMEMRTKAIDQLRMLRNDIDRWKSDYSHVAFVIQQIIPWLEPRDRILAVNRNEFRCVTLTDLDQMVTRACDLILATIQRIPDITQSLPKTTEDSAWMTKQETILASIIKNFHMRAVALAISDTLKQLKHLDSLSEPQGSVSVSAIFSMALPILQQYHILVRNTVEEFASLHRSICKISSILAQSLLQVITQGFCTPSDKSDASGEKTEKPEGGTGLGEGEGAEDISEDIQDDEDLAELAQQPATKGDMEELADEKDAVDIDGELEGEMDNAPEHAEDETDTSSGGEDDENMDEEVGNVGDLNASEVDEKLWDGAGPDESRDEKAEERKGSKVQDEQVAAQGEKSEMEEKGENDKDEDEDGEELEGAQESEEVVQDESNRTDPQVPEADVLELPEDMDLGGDERSDMGGDGSEDEHMGELSDVEDSEQAVQEDATLHEDSEQEPDNGSVTADADNNLEADAVDNQGEIADNDQTKTDEAPNEDQVVDNLEPEHATTQEHTEPRDATDDKAQTDVAIGTGQEDDIRSEEIPSVEIFNKSKGSQGESSNLEQGDAAEEAKAGLQPSRDSDLSPEQSQLDQATKENQAFHKLGDALERFHRRQRQILEASQDRDREEEEQAQMNLDGPEFEHLADDSAKSDAQALGTATEEQAHTVDEEMAVDSELDRLPNDFQDDEMELQEQGDTDVAAEEALKRLNAEKDDLEDTRPGAFMGYNTKVSGGVGERHLSQSFPEEDLEKVDEELSTIHLSEPNEPSARSPENARRLWSHYETLTCDLSLSLTEQLRLILAPTMATKMRGDFRTGKRLNIKRIIPYIASQYKRDKIWMRRSIPTKRSYQIMLAVDDSKSMGESGSGALAFETLALVSRSLSMLEVGEISVVSFGDTIRIAHEFCKPFNSEAGVRAFEHFGFQQTKTDVRRLIAETIGLFRQARARSSASTVDLWQLQLIISDGVCEDHDAIRRLVRQAQEERIMIVFIIIDALRGSSITDMSQAKFAVDETSGTGGMKLTMERYLDGFPFGYYLIVSNVKELPSVLATALRQWFVEVVEASG